MVDKIVNAAEDFSHNHTHIHKQKIKEILKILSHWPILKCQNIEYIDWNIDWNKVEKYYRFRDLNFNSIFILEMYLSYGGELF